MTPRRPTVGWSLIATACGVLVLTGCSSSGSAPAAGSSPTASDGAVVRSLTRALVAKSSGTVREAKCGAATPAEIAAGPFGSDSKPQFTCTLNGASYDVQVQDNGCYVAERHGGGRAIYGCGVRAVG